jgi:hypothetical protein
MTATAATATVATQIKEKMANMPDSLDTKKEVEAYFKDAMKNLNVDDKPKKGLNRYQQYVKDNIKEVKEQNKDLNGKQVLTLIAKMWKELNGETVKPKEEAPEAVEAVATKPKEEIDEIQEIAEAVAVKPKKKK